MKKLFTAAAALVLSMGALFAATPYVAPFPNINVWTNATVGGTNFANNIVVTQALTAVTLNVGTINYTNPPIPPSFTVASLPASQNGATAFASDALTPTTGVGAPVSYDVASSSWLLSASRIKAASGLRAYMENSARASWTGDTPYDLAILLGDGATFSTGTSMAGAPSFNGYSGGTSGGGSATGTEGNYIKAYVYTAAASPSGWTVYANNFNGIGTGPNAALQFSSALNMSVLSDSTDKYLYIYGLFDNGTLTNLPTYGVFLLYDCFKLLSTSNATNNWQLVTATNSNYTFTDTGLAVNATSGVIPDKLGAVWMTNSVVAYTNGVAAATNTTTCPSGATLLYFGFKGYKASGSSLRYMRYFYPYLHIRRVTPVSAL